MENQLNRCVCRLCATEKYNYINVYDTGYAYPLNLKIRKYLHIEVTEEDTLPKNICWECYTKLNEYSAFVDYVQICQRTLQDMFVYYNSNDTKKVLRIQTGFNIDEDLNIQKYLLQNVVNRSEEKYVDDVTVIEVKDVCEEACVEEGASCEGAFGSTGRTGEECPIDASIDVNDSFHETVNSLGARVGGNCDSANHCYKSSNCDTAVTNMLISRMENREDNVDRGDTAEDIVKQSSPDKQDGCNASVRCSTAEESSDTTDRTINSHSDKSTVISDGNTNSDQVSDTPKGQNNGTIHDNTSVEKLHTDKMPRALLRCKKITDISTGEKDHLQIENEIGHHRRNKQSKVSLVTHDQEDFDIDESETFREKYFDKINWLCSKCDQKFTTLRELQNHERNSHSCFELVCPFCYKVYVQYRNFVSHVKHHPHTPYCQICNKVFTTDKVLQNHMATHTNSRPHVCKQCGKEFKQRSTLSLHEKCHLPAKTRYQYVCKHCDQKFSTKGNLKKHEAIHAEKRTFVCEKCGKGFVQKVNLLNHLMTHDDNKQFSCEVCKKHFRTSGSLKKHGEIHTKMKQSHQCEECGKLFSERKSLMDHFNTHSDLRPYTCSHCPKTFKFRTVLMEHLKVHAGKRNLFSCSRCKYEVLSWRAYSKHMLMQHGIVSSKLKQNEDQPEILAVPSPSFSDIFLKTDNDVERNSSAYDESLFWPHDLQDVYATLQSHAYNEPPVFDDYCNTPEVQT